MIQDLSDLAALGKANTNQLAAINFEETLLSNAATQADEMAEILAHANGEKGDNGASKIIRD